MRENNPHHRSKYDRLSQRASGLETSAERAKRGLTSLVAGGMAVVGVATLPLLAYSESFDLPPMPVGVVWMAVVFTVTQVLGFLLAAIPGRLVPAVMLTAVPLVATPFLISVQMADALEFVALTLMFASIPVLHAAAALGPRGAIGFALLNVAGLGAIALWAFGAGAEVLVAPAVMLFLVTFMSLAVSRTESSLQGVAQKRTTELERANLELAQANRAKGAFLANMSHELRTPLNSIIGFSGLMQQGLAGPLSEEQEAQIAMVNRSGKHLLLLVDEILDVTRIESGGMSVHSEEFDPAELVVEVADTLRPAAAQKSIGLHVELPRSNDTMVSDRGKVKQILLHLAGNAVKFIDSGRVELRLENAADDRMVFRVRDTGHGIPEWALERVFESFMQRKTSEGEKPSGTGLGLTISSEYAALLGGQITASSEVGTGSEFTLTLPRIHPSPSLDS